MRESRIGLLFNGIIKIPMQFLVLAVGVMVFVFYQFNAPPLHFNELNRKSLVGTPQEAAFEKLEMRADTLFQEKQGILKNYAIASSMGNESDLKVYQQRLAQLDQAQTGLRKEAATVIKQAHPEMDVNDKDYVFIRYILSQMPVGLIGIMLAMIFCASWSTTASELSALTATTVSDIYRRSIVKGRDDTHYMRMSKWVTVFWGVFIVIFASFANLFENLIQAVNMVGSIFYGTILGIFFTAFFVKQVKGQAVFYAALITEAIVVFLFFGVDRDAYLWYNPLACGLVMGLGLLLQFTVFRKK